MEITKTRYNQLERDEENFQTHVKQRKEAQVQSVDELEKEHIEEMKKMAEHFAKQRDEMKKAYEVEISRDAALYDEKLTDLRKSGEDRLKEEKTAQEKAFDGLQLRERAKIDSYRKNQEDIVTKLHEEYQTASESLNQTRDGRA